MGSSSPSHWRRAASGVPPWFPVARVWWGCGAHGMKAQWSWSYLDRALQLGRSSYQVEWIFPGGGIKCGETPDAAARRELAEEIDLAAPGLMPS